jgi:hypothetical protein
MKIAKVGTTALSAPFRAASSQQINDLRKQKSCGRARIGEVRLAATPAPHCDAPVGLRCISGTNIIAPWAPGNGYTPGFGGGNGDTIAPTISGTSDITAEATSAAGASVSYTTPSATDNVDKTVSVSCAPLSGSTFAIGTTVVSCSATDHAGNSSSSSFHIIVRDTTAPSVSVKHRPNSPSVAWNNQW